MAASVCRPRPRRQFGPVGRRLAVIRTLLPQGRPLSDDRWEARHRGIAALMLLHLPALFFMGLATHHTVVHSAVDVFGIACCAYVAFRQNLTRHVRSGATTLGLVLCSAVLVHLSGGNIEMHFHFFVVVGVITLYQDWVPFLLALIFVVLHHGILGVLDPGAVYNHPAAKADPWLWAGIHGAFVLAASVAHVLAWRLNEDQALSDDLTRLPNRALLSDRIRTALTKRAVDGHDVTVLFVDLDGFKSVNDTMGHAAGDRLLIEVAQRIKSIIRSSDTAARLGGDEFAVLLDGHDRSAAVLVAHRILAALERPIRIGGDTERTISASIGVVAVSTETDVDQVLRNADLAMYMAKATGRGRVEVFEEAMFDEALDRADLERDLRDAVSAGDLTVAYQPCVDIATGAVLGVEALVRWSHPTRGNVPPNVFIPVAETTGMILDLGRHVLRTACFDAVRLRHAQPELTMAVNVSARQLSSPAFARDVENALRDSSLPGAALVLEITESMLVHDVELTVARLGELRDLGVRLAIDDFGTGYSSLSYLRHFPIDILKIDRSFVEHLPGEGAALTRSIVRMGQSLRLEIVAEGVEDDAQRAELERLGCQRAQGYLFAEPRPVSHIDDLLRRANTQPEWWRAPIAGIPAPRESSDAVVPTA